MSAEWCLSIVEEAIQMHGTPEIINSDQGSHFIAFEYTSQFGDQMQISMDGKGRAIDNIFIERLRRSVKFEWVYLKVFEDGVQLNEGLQEYFNFYNHK
jgi:putative transposase